MKRILALLTCTLVFALTGCNANDFESSSTTEILSSSTDTATDDMSEKTTFYKICYEGNSITDITQQKPELSQPFTNGSFTVQKPVSPWSEGDVKSAWQMTASYGKMNSFSDCVFADFTGDNIAEMLLVCGNDKIFYIFQKSGETVSLLAKSELDAHIANGVFLTNPPLEESEFTDVALDEYYKLDKFSVFEDSDKQKYLVIISWSGTLGEVCEIRKIDVKDGKIAFPVAYRWGLFKEMSENFMDTVMKYQKFSESGFVDVYKREIGNFLSALAMS